MGNESAPFRFEQVINLTTGEPLYYEILLPLAASGFMVDGGVQQFVERAETTGLISCIDRAVLEVAIDSLEADRDASMGVNISYMTIQTVGQSVLKRIKQLPSKLRERLILEITETVKPSRISECHHFIVDVKRLGVRVALDDFGCGHHDKASPTFFNGMRFMPDIIKIDGSIMKGYSLKKNSRRIASAVSNARAFGTVLVGEHIESQDILEFARSIGIEFGQGRHFQHNQIVAKPIG